MSVLATLPAAAAVFLVPTDRELIQSAEAIVLATVSERHTEFAQNGDIVTISDLDVIEVLKGPIDRAQPLRVRVPGGAVGEKAMFTSAPVTFVARGRVLLFLQRTDGGWWTSYGLTLGAFHSTKDESGTAILVRGSHGETIIGFAKDDLRPWNEPARNEQRFLRFIRRVVGNDSSTDGVPKVGPLRVQPHRAAETDYFVEPPQEQTWELRAETNHYPPSAYTAGNFRWDVFDRGGSVSFRITGSQPGYDSSGAAQRALAAWTNDTGSNIVYLLAAGTGGAFVQDGINSIVFNSSTDVPSGAIAYAKWYANATHTYKGETFYSISEGDVVVKSNLSVSQAVFDEAVTHELGHTLGLRHSDQGTPSSTQAVMRASVTGQYGANLGPWDVEAAGTVYTASTVCTPPTIVSGPTSTTTYPGQSTTLSVTATGTPTLTYQWFVGTTGNTTQPIGTGPSITVAPTTTTSYWVRVSNACGVADSATATVTVTSAAPPPGGTPAGRSFAGDFNADGRSDILLQSSNGDVAIWLMNGFTITSAGVVASPGSAYRVVGAGEFNGDGRSDVVLQHISTGDVAIWMMNGLTISSAAIIGSPGSAWVAATIGDHNGDRRSDIVLRNVGDGSVAIWLMSGFTISAGAVVGQPGTAWRVATSGDLNADGRSDLVLQNTSDGSVAAWLMNGFTIASGAVIATPAPSWQVVISGDLNADGRRDLVLRNESTGDVAAWLMNSFTIAGAGMIGSPGIGYRVATGGDFNGNGTADIILQQSSGTVAEWQMSSLTITAGAVVASPTVGWWVVGY